MIGLAGIIHRKDYMAINKREFTLKRILLPEKKWNSSFDLLSEDDLSICIIRRDLGDNRDLSLKKIGNNIFGFEGYGKFSGERKLYWADDMIDRVSDVLNKEDVNILTTIEGSFLLFAYYNNEIIILSDRFGTKPCYIYHDAEKILFAPSVTSLLDFNLVDREKDLDAVKQLLMAGFFLNDSTLAKNVIKFPAGTLMVGRISEKIETQINKYWDLPRMAGAIDAISEEVINTFSDKFQFAINELFDLEPRFLVPLSGGLDSRAIACFLSEKKNIKTITYDFGDETIIAGQVCKILNSDSTFFTKQMISSKKFRDAITEYILSQCHHSVPNQYFYAPLFCEFFSKNQEYHALFDGVYLDILFSAPYTYANFEFNKFVGVYGGAISFLDSHSYSVKKASLLELLKRIYNENLKHYEDCDGVSKSQKCYVSGRLRRYVSESYLSREHYGYVFKPGYNYELMDFGFQLSLRLRKGLLYRELLKRKFPEVMKIKYKDSYGNRHKTMMEDISRLYQAVRFKLSYASQGILKCYPYQADYYFLGRRGIDEFKDLFVNYNCLSEIFKDDYLPNLFNKVSKKQYLLNHFSRILFIQQFYCRNHFSGAFPKSR